MSADAPSADGTADLNAVRVALIAASRRAAVILATACRLRGYTSALVPTARGRGARPGVWVELEAPLDVVEWAGSEARFDVADAYQGVLAPRFAVRGVEFYAPGAELFTYAAIP